MEKEERLKSETSFDESSEKFAKILSENREKYETYYRLTQLTNNNENLIDDVVLKRSINHPLNIIIR